MPFILEYILPNVDEPWIHLPEALCSAESSRPTRTPVFSQVWVDHTQIVGLADMKTSTIRPPSSHGVFSRRRRWPSTIPSCTRGVLHFSCKLDARPAEGPVQPVSFADTGIPLLFGAPTSWGRSRHAGLQAAGGGARSLGFDSARNARPSATSWRQRLSARRVPRRVASMSLCLNLYDGRCAPSNTTGKKSRYDRLGQACQPHRRYSSPAGHRRQVAPCQP